LTGFFTEAENGDIEVGADQEAVRPAALFRKASMVVNRASCFRRGRRSIRSNRLRSLRLGLCGGSMEMGFEGWSSSSMETSRAAAKRRVAAGELSVNKARKAAYGGGGGVRLCAV
jgi:hypothetical protein